LIARVYFYIIFIVFSASVSTADDRSNARATGMGFSSIVSGTGLNAYNNNPANFDINNFPKLKLSSDKRQMIDRVYSSSTWELSAFSAGGGYGSDTTINFYNNYLSYLSIDRQKFVNLFTTLTSVLEFRQNVLPNERTDVNYDFELRWFSINFSKPGFGTINATISDKVGLNTNVYSKDEALPLEFGIYIDPLTGKTDLTNVKLTQAEAIAWWIRKYSIGYAKQIILKKNSILKSVSVGFSGSLVHGFGNVSTYESKITIGTWGVKNNNGVNHVDSIKAKQDFHTQLAVTDFFRDYSDGSETKFNLFPKPAGKGYSFDLGITLRFSDELQVAASVTDLGRITWNYNTITNNDTDSFAYYDFELATGDPTYNTLVNDLGGYYTQDSGTAFTTGMPTKFRAGVMYKPSNKFLVEFNWVKGTNNLPGNSSANIFSLGAEYFPVDFIPVRAGFSAGGPGGYYVSAGTGLKFKDMTLDVGIHGINQILADRRFSVAFRVNIMRNF
jgi:hypothetical protein